MALILLGGNLADIRGSVGGVTFARNRYGLFQRNRTKPIDPASASQEAYRTRFAAAIVNWRALTAAQRLAFNAKALNVDFVNALGQSFHPSGFNLFARSDMLLDIAGVAAITVPPTSPTINDSNTFVSYDAGTGFDINSTIANWPGGATLLVWYEYDLSSCKFFYKGPYTHYHDLLAGEFVADVVTLQTTAGILVDTAMFAMWRLVGTDGAASSVRRGRAYKPPA